MQHGERRERIRGEAAAAAASVLWAGPCVRSAAVRHGLGCGGRRRRGAPDSAYSEAPGRHVSRAASLQSPRGLARSGSCLARSLHLLPLAVLQPVRNDAVSGPLPPFAPGPGSEQGAGRRMESARGEGRNRRKHPEAPPAGRAGQPPPVAPGGAREGGRGGGGGGGTRTGGTSALAGSSRAGVPRDFAPRTSQPPGVEGTPLLYRCDGSPSSRTAWNRRLSRRKANRQSSRKLLALAQRSAPSLPQDWDLLRKMLAPRKQG
ncbi:translation initiation factor IF-2-like isoform X2 [Ursus americanus]|uniref:translation initiation factor IF-2-like isoform X2 n=1 Tax=Ursus americanus TaxID=9643 RepID=UPI001E67B741|nr:translation initiation factor IF-2-like isoform X2 [Ursus americanus]